MSSNAASSRRSFVPRVSAQAVIWGSFLVLAAGVQAQLQSQGPNNPNPINVISDNGGPGTSAWTNPNNGAVSDNAYAVTAPGNLATKFLKATDFGFSIPDPAEIKGIEVFVERSSSLGTIFDAAAQLVKGGVIGGTDHALGGTWPTTDAVANYGSDSDLWGLTWTPADINSTGFGFALQANGSLMLDTAGVDAISITVHYDLCADAPAAGCLTASKSLFIVKDKGADNAKDKMIWKWIKGQSTQQADFGDPTVPVTGAQNALCIYANGALAGEALVGPSGTLWAVISTKGYKYKDKAATQDGIKKIIQKGSTSDKAKIIESGKGAGLPDLVPPLTLPVEVQLVNSESGVCWTSVFSSATKNVAGTFKAK